MTKYKIVKESNVLPEGWAVGDVLEKNNWFAPSSRIGTLQAWFHIPNKSDATSPQHTAALLELGVVEEVKEWNPRTLEVGDDYWYVGGTDGLAEVYAECWRNRNIDIFRRAADNCHPTKEAAEAWLGKLLADYK